jgi:hypothetical protein
LPSWGGTCYTSGWPVDGDAHTDRIFRDLIDMPATVAVAADQVTVRFHRRAHLPIIIDSRMLDSPVSVPWWNGAALRLTA